MNVPAYTSPFLCLGGTYDITKSEVGGDIFSSGVPTKKTKKNLFTLSLKNIQNSQDAKDVLNASGDTSLKVKLGLIEAKGSGKYLNYRKTKEDTTEILAVIRIHTETETIDTISLNGSEAREKRNDLGTHYVRSVTYGAELTAMISFKTSSTTKMQDISGKFEGDFLTGFNLNVLGFKSRLESLAADSCDESKLELQYSATGCPDKSPTTVADLLKLIEDFPATLKNINEGIGVPMEYGLMPIENVIQTSEELVRNSVAASTKDLMEQCIDDLRDAQASADEYLKDDDDEDHVDVLNFGEEITKLKGEFKDAVEKMYSSKGGDLIDKCLKAYKDAIDGRQLPGKFCREWRKILKTKKPPEPSTSVKLPPGKPLKVVLLGKTGNGKSATGNTLLGREVFEENSGAKSNWRNCRVEKGEDDEREIVVIDTPGFMDAGTEHSKSWLCDLKETQEKVLKEAATMFSLAAPHGFDAIALVAKYGNRLTWEDEQTFTLIREWLGKEAEKHMFLILTFADQARRKEKEKVSLDEKKKTFIKSFPPWLQKFVNQIGEDRVLLFDNSLELNTDASKEQVSRFIQIIDQDTAGPFVPDLTKVAVEECDKQIKKALKKTGLDEIKLHLEQRKENIESKLKLHKDESPGSREALQRELETVNAELNCTNERITEEEKSVVWEFLKYCAQFYTYFIEPISKRLSQLMDLVSRTFTGNNAPQTCFTES